MIITIICLFFLCYLGNSGVGKTVLIESMLRSLTAPDGNFVRAGTILGDVLQYSAARGTISTKLAQAGESSLENAENSSKFNNRKCIFVVFRWPFKI